MMYKGFIFSLLLLLNIQLGKAQFWKTKISGNGHVTTELRNIDDFDKLTVTGPFDVKIVNGHGKLTVKADENLMNIIETYVKSDKLVIRINPDFNIKKYTKLSIEVPAEYLSKIILTGSGHISNDSFFSWHDLKLILTGSGEMDFLTKIARLDVVITGSGEIKLQGQADRLEGALTGSGTLLAKGLEAKDVKINLTGSGDAYVKCQERLTIKIFGSGDVYYFGEPKNLKSNIFGSGEVHFRKLK